MLTPEKEKEIRAICSGTHLGWPGDFMRELLAEIDRLRAESLEYKRKSKVFSDSRDRWMQSCDELNIELERLSALYKERCESRS
jgi:hypothetical protein